MSFEMQIKIKNDQGVKEFVSIRCGGNPGYTYRWPTRKQAEQALRSYYPSIFGEDINVLEVNEPANIGLDYTKEI